MSLKPVILPKKRKLIINKEICDYCYPNKIDKENKYCSNECEIAFNNIKSIKLALNRIKLDKILYSNCNKSILNILLMIWSYIHNKSVLQENRDEMLKRLIEEMIEMANTCSSGFVSRLINVISGFGVFNLRISWDDQITANFSGRLNARIRDIDNPKSIYFTNEKETIQLIKFYLEENEEEKEDDESDEDEEKEEKELKYKNSIGYMQMKQNLKNKYNNTEIKKI